MAEFTPDPPPLDLPAVPDVLSPNIPLNPPMVGTASPFIHVDGQNRDLILEAIRTWVRVSLLPWTTSWQSQLTEWEGDVATQLDAWMTEAEEYITEYAVAGYSFRTTVTPIAPEGTTNVVLTSTDVRPLVVGDLVLDESSDGNYGQITVVIDATHATVTYLGSLRGPTGYSVRLTNTPIADEGTTNVALAADDTNPFQVGDIVLDTTSDSNFGQITAIIDTTHVTVNFQGTLKGAQGIQGVPGEPGTNGSDGLVTSVVAGANINVDSTNPAHPIVTGQPGVPVYTDPVVMNTAASGDTLPDGQLGALVTDGIVSLWTIRDSVWQSPVISFPTNVPADWTAFAVPFVTGSLANMSLQGAFASEDVNGTHPVWSVHNQAFTQDHGYNRFPTIGSHSAGSGSAFVNPDNSISANNMTAIEVLGVAPDTNPDTGLPNDLSSGYEMHTWGQLPFNSVLQFNFSNTESGPDTGANLYASFGETIQLNDGTLTHDPDGVNPLGGIARFDLVSDTTGAPTFFDVVMRVYHVAHTSSPTIVYYEAVYYNNPNGGDGMTVMFKNTTTGYYYGTAPAKDGFMLSSAHVIDATTLTVKAI